MQLRGTAGHAAIVTALLLSAVQTARAQNVTFSELRDAVPSKFFDAASSQVSPLDAKQLVIGFNSGFDYQTWTTNDFKASTLPYSNRTAADTISFVVTAPDGFYVSKITYTQRGTASFSRGSVQSGTTQWTVADFPASLGVFSNPNLKGTADLKALGLQSVTVSITVSLFAAATGSVAVTGADVVVEVEPIVNEPPANDSPVTGDPAPADGSATAVEPSVADPPSIQ